MPHGDRQFDTFDTGTEPPADAGARGGLPRLVRLYIRQVLIGFGLSAVFVGLLLGLDVAHLRSLMVQTQGGAIAAFLLFFFNGLVFAGVQFAITIMRMAEPEDRTPRGGRRARAPRILPEPVPELVAAPVPVEVTSGR